MSLLKKIFRTSKSELTQLLERSITNLRVGVFGRLLNKYTPIHGKERGKLLSAAILKVALLEDPENDAAESYLVQYKDLVETELLKVHTDLDVAEGLSYLYAAQTLHIAIATRNPFSERAAELGQRATALSIYIPNTYDICGTGDANDCILAISRYATSFAENARLRGHRPGRR